MMTNVEIEREFDVLYSNISSGAAPNLEVYEKSLFLTRAQEELVRLYYNGANARYMSFESDEESRRYLDTLVMSRTASSGSPSQYGRFNDYAFPKNVTDGHEILFMLRENAVNASNGCLGGTVMQVIPVRHEDLNRVLEDPFKAPNGRKALRYDLADDAVRFHILSAVPISEYRCVFLKRPAPIVLGDVSGMSIDGVEDAPDGGVYDIPDSLMRKVISRACELAKAAYTGDLNVALALDARDI